MSSGGYALSVILRNILCFVEICEFVGKYTRINGKSCPKTFEFANKFLLMWGYGVDFWFLFLTVYNKKTAKMKNIFQNRNILLSKECGIIKFS